MLYAAELQRVIADLQQDAFDAKDKQEKVALTSLELRARLVPEAWRKLQGVNQAGRLRSLIVW